MPNRRILKDTAYIYHYTGEANYEATYALFTVKHCSLQHRYGVSRGDTNVKPENSARLYIFDGDSTVTDSSGNVLKFIEPDKYAALSPTEKAGKWTVATDEKDYFGDTLCDGVPTAGVPNYYKITGYTRYDTGSKRIHHTELNGK